MHIACEKLQIRGRFSALWNRILLSLIEHPAQNILETKVSCLII